MRLFSLILWRSEPAASSVAKRTGYRCGRSGVRLPGTGQIGTVSPTARLRCDVSSELCSPGAKPRRWAPPLVTRFGVIPRV